MRARTPSATSRARSSARSCIGTVIYIALQIVFLGALPRERDRQHLGRRRAYTAITGPFAAARDAARPRLAGHDHLHRRDHLPGRHRPDLHDRQLAGLLRPGRNGYVPTVFEWTNDRGVPWVGLIAAFVVGCICFLPFPSWQSLVGLITSASVLMYAGAPLVARRLPPAAAGRRPALPAAGAAGSSPGSRSSSPA